MRRTFFLIAALFTLVACGPNCSYPYNNQPGCAVYPYGQQPYTGYPQQTPYTGFPQTQPYPYTGFPTAYQPAPYPVAPYPTPYYGPSPYMYHSEE